MNISVTQAAIRELVCDGDMDKIWKAIQSELGADITVEYVGGPVQIRFGDYISGSFKRIRLGNVISELIAGIAPDELDYYEAIADALGKGAKRIRKAIAKSKLRQTDECPK